MSAAKSKKCASNGGRLVVEHRLAIAGDAVEQLSVDEAADGVDPLGQPEAHRHGNVGRGKAEFPPALVTGHHLAFDEPVVAEEAVGFLELPAERFMRIIEEEIATPPSLTSGSTLTSKPCAAPAALRKSGVPRRLRPKWKSAPITTPATPGRRPGSG